MSKLIAKTLAALAIAVASCVLITGASQAEVEAEAEAEALNAFSYIASFGKDANKCTLVAPCRTLQKGISRTRSRGVLQIGESGHYGSGTITRSITILATPGTATVGAIVITGDVDVVLRGLLLNGSTTAANTPGISIPTGATSSRVHIESCTVERFSGSGGHGIVIGAANSSVTVSDSIVRYNGGNGIWLGAQGGLLTAKSTTTLYNSNSGYVVSANGAMILNSVVATSNVNGVVVAGGVAHISNSVVNFNLEIGLFNSSGTLFSPGNNTVTGNFSIDKSGPITPSGGL